jgi:transcriptional regulator with XRE-family HTH domain
MSESSRPSDVFPQRLRKARDLRDLNQLELAEKAGMQASAISHFETGGRKPSFDNLRRLADALDVTTDYLLGRVEDVGATAAADQLHRDIRNLKATDRTFAEEMIQRMAARAKSKSSTRE